MQMQLVHKIGPKYLYSSPTKFFEVNRQLPLFSPLAVVPKLMGIMTDAQIQGDQIFLRSTSGRAGMEDRGRGAGGQGAVPFQIIVV